MNMKMLFCAAMASVMPWIAAESTEKSYPVTVKVQCSSPEEAQKAELKFLPLPHGKNVAFSCRWDDTSKRNARMQKLMAKYGYKGNFYLNQIDEKYQKTILPQLLKNGCSIGNHTLNHFYLPLITPNSANYEILGARILHESVSDRPEHAFVSPYVSVSWRLVPDAEQIISSCLRRAGILGGPDWAVDRLNKLPGNHFYSTQGKMICPGDRNTKTEKFDSAVKRYQPQAGKTAHMTLGIHVWHSDKDFQTLEESLKKYANRPDWWYCNENEYLAYMQMYHHARISNKKVEGNTVFFTVALPFPEDLGDTMSLWAECAGKPVEIRHSRNIPQRIDAVNADGESMEFPGIKAQITLEKGTKLRLKINNTGADLEDVRITLRLPPVFKKETLFVQLPRIRGEYTKEWNLEANSAITNAGMQLTAAQIDFTRKGVSGRIWASSLQKNPHPAKDILPAFYSTGKFTNQQLAALSMPDSKPETQGFKPLEHDFNYRSYAYKPLRGKHNIVIIDFTGQGKMILKAASSSGAISNTIYFNGKKIDFKTGVAEVDAGTGPCRVVMTVRNSFVFLASPAPVASKSLTAKK